MIVNPSAKVSRGDEVVWFFFNQMRTGYWKEDQIGAHRPSVRAMNTIIRLPI